MLQRPTQAVRRFFRALEQNLDADDDLNNAVRALKIVYARLAQHMPRITSDFRGQSIS